MECNIILLKESIFILQSESPSGSKLNALGKYLLCSLVFVVFALIEFAVVVVLKRRLDGGASVVDKLTTGGPHITRVNPQGGYMEKSEPSINEKLGNIIFVQKNCGSLKSTQTTDNVDNVALILFFASYLIFNCVYWVEYL